MIMLTSESNAGQERDREQPSDRIDAIQESWRTAVYVQVSAARSRTGRPTVSSSPMQKADGAERLTKPQPLHSVEA